MCEDTVVFAWISGELIADIKLLHEGFELLDLINVINDILLELLILPEIERIIRPTQIEIV